MGQDLRGWRLALVPEVLVNPPPSLSSRIPDVVGVLEATGYGVLQLPASSEHRLLLAVTADQVAEYAHHGYAVVAIGLRHESGNALHWRQLAPLLRHRGVSLPPRHLIDPEAGTASERQRLADFLAGYDLPLEDRRRWRV